MKLESLADRNREEADLMRERRAEQKAIEQNFNMPDDLEPGMHVMVGQAGRRELILATVEDVRSTYITVIIPGPRRISDILHMDDPRHNNPDRRDGIGGFWIHTPHTLKERAATAIMSERLANLEKIIETLQIPLPSKPSKPKKKADKELEELRARAKELNIPKAGVLGKTKLTAALNEITNGNA